MRLIDADVLKEKFKEHYDLFVSAYKNEQDMNLADRSRVDEILNSMAEVINAPTVCDIDAIRDEIAKCLEAINHIKAMPIQLYTPNEIEARKLTYEQCIGFIDKYTKGE